jgi:hypothetical protein
MKFIIDIDGTISNGEQALLRFYSDDLQIGVDPRMIDVLTSYSAFFDLPQVKAFCERVEKPRRIFEASRERAITLPEIVSRFEIIPGAVEGLWQLATRGTICYYTVRKPEVEETTCLWLERHRFPNAHQVVLCRSVLGKLRQLYEREWSSSERFILIDDRATQMVEEYSKLASGDYQQMLPQWQEIATFLQARVTLVAFGVPSIGIHPSLQLATLASWDYIDHIVALSSHSI